MTPSEIDELERLYAKATPGPWLLTGDSTLVNVTHTTRDVWTFPRTEADMVYLGALLNAASALIEAAREVERLRAFVPRWEPAPRSLELRLMVGTGEVARIVPFGVGRWYDTQAAATDYPTANDAARAVCTRLGIPYVPVEVDDG